MAIKAKVGRRGQITIPCSIRRMMKLEEGDSIAFIKLDNEYLIYPLNDTLLDLRGSIKVDGPQDFTEIRQRVRNNRIGDKKKDVDS